MSDDVDYTFAPSPSDRTDIPDDIEKKRKSIDLLGVSAAQFAKLMTNAFKQSTAGGKEFDDVLRNMALKLSSMAVTNAFKPIAKSFSKGFGDIFKDIFNGGSSSDGGNTTTSSGGLPTAFFAKGGIKPFASGGVISTPSYFPMSGGLGLAGEAGPEAIMALSRGSDGKLGVAMSGGATSNITVQIMTPDVGSFQRSESYLTGQIARAVLRGQRSL
ncbi:MAG TPA: phage tail tape measure protein [Pseudolabrys sp.]